VLIIPEFIYGFPSALDDSRVVRTMCLWHLHAVGTVVLKPCLWRRSWRRRSPSLICRAMCSRGAPDLIRLTIAAASPSLWLCIAWYTSIAADVSLSSASVRLNNAFTGSRYMHPRPLTMQRLHCGREPLHSRAYQQLPLYDVTIYV
jgi:hypothetical protein